MHQYLEDIEEIMNKTRNYQAEDVVNENEELLLRFHYQNFCNQIIDVSKEMFSNDGTKFDLVFVTDLKEEIQAHTLIFCLHSKFLEGLLSQEHMCTKPIYVTFPGVTRSVLTSVMELVYLGQCHIDTDQMPSVKTVLDMLGITGAKMESGFLGYPHF